MNMLFRAWSPRFGMSEPFRLFDEIEFHNTPDGGMSAIVKPGEPECNHMTIMIWTGRNDSKGTPIFLSDYIETTYNDVGSGWDFTDRGPVVLDSHGRFGYLKHYNSGPMISVWSDKRTYVVGNKFENPDMEKIGKKVEKKKPAKKPKRFKCRIGLHGNMKPTEYPYVMKCGYCGHSEYVGP